MFGKITQIVSGGLRNERDLASELSNLQEKYLVLDQRYEIVREMLAKAKQVEGVAEENERLKAAILALERFLAVKNGQAMESIRLQQEELSKKRDLIEQKEQELKEKEAELEVRSRCLDIIEAGNK
jgi:uncharacterized protein (DUF3084 family)